MTSSPASRPLSPEKIQALSQGALDTAALQTAVELDLFTVIGRGQTTAAEIAQSTRAAERGIAALADFLVVRGLLTKSGSGYGLSPDSAMFLDRRSPACIADTAGWWGLSAKRIMTEGLTAAVRRGGAQAAMPDPATWVVFARSMAPMMRIPAEYTAQHLVGDLLAGGGKVLDIAGGHGLYGIAVGRRFPEAEITIVDSAPVLEVAKENAKSAGLAGRYRTLAGSALPSTPGEVQFGEGYRLILITAFLHHFDPEMNTNFLRKVHAALAPGGMAITTDFVPNQDRVSPPFPAMFSLVMLSMTEKGNAYTFDEYQRMFREAGFPTLDRQEIPQFPATAMLARR